MQACCARPKVDGTIVITPDFPQDPDRPQPERSTAQPIQKMPARAHRSVGYRIARWCGVIALLGLLAGLLMGIMFQVDPPLFLETVDATRTVLGPAPVAYFETTVFGVGTLINTTRVKLGDTAPRWQLEQSPVPVEPRAALSATAPARAILPTDPPLPTDSALPTLTPVPQFATPLPAIRLSATANAPAPVAPAQPQTG